MAAATDSRAVPPLRGDEDALYRAHHVHLLRVTRRRFPDAPYALVEDACGFAWAQLLRRQPERDAVVGWLVVVARHELLRLLGREGAARPLEEAPEPVAPCPRHEEARALLDAMAALRPYQRRVLALQAAGHSYREIQAACGGRTFTWVNRHATEGRRAVREALAA
jgi:DNA-directed RNA polymerase specialized sigma24 family protein